MSEQITFIILAALTCFPAVGVVTSRNVFHAGLWLVPTLVGVAGLYLTLGAEFISAIQVLVYIGGIMVLLLFAVLLTRRIGGAEVISHNRLEGWGFVAALVSAAGLIWGAAKQFGGELAMTPLPTGTTENMGAALLGPYLLAFEISSIVLLAAIIGAIVIARGEHH